MSPSLQHESSDQAFMRQALELAQLGLGWTSPNPPVGALLVRDGQGIGRGAHLLDGAEHAELLALQSAGDARGSDCFISLEPCSHQGRQPPCTSALIEAGVARVIYGVADSDARSCGRSRAILEQAGIEVVSSVLEAECRRFLDFYNHAQRGGLPFVHLKLALSADGQMACANGASQWLSGSESLGYAHYLRQKYDAIMVSARTVLADNPRLSARMEQLAHYSPLAAKLRPRNPVRVVLDPRFETLPQLSGLNISDFSGSFRSGFPKLIIIGSSKHLPAGAELPPDASLHGLPVDNDGTIPFAAVLELLKEYSIQSLLVEGGPGLIRLMLQQRSADKLSLVYTPTLIGSDGLSFSPQLGSQSIADCPRITDPIGTVLGDDLVMEGYPQWPGDT